MEVRGMSDFDQSVKQMMGQLTTLYSQCALLIKAADALFLGKKWTTKTNQCVSLGIVPDSSRSWFPHDVFRFYEGDEPSSAHIMPFVSIILNDREKPENLPQPMLTAGWFDYGSEHEVGKDYRFWYAHVWTWIEERRQDGGFVTVVQKEAWPTWKQAWETVTVTAVPLRSVTTQDELNAKIVAPLFERMGG
jgi:hypothetical protein